MQHQDSPPARKVSLAPDLSDRDERTVRAWTERMAVRPLGGGRYAVDSESDSTYVVDLPRSRCTCPDHEIRGERCKHVRRVAIEVTERRVPPPGERRAVCAGCGRDAFVDEDAVVPLCPDCRLEPGDAVRDRETGDLLVVARVTPRRADEVRVPDHDCTVATYAANWKYDPADPVVEAVYAGDAARSDDPRRYSFPLSRLERADVDLPGRFGH